MSSYKESRAFGKYFLQHQPLVLPFNSGTSAVIVIPVLADFMIFRTLESIKACEFPVGTEVVVVVNHSIDASNEVKKKNSILIEKLRNIDFSFPLHIIKLFDVKTKYAGVGFARKAGMDAAAYFFYKSGRKKGIIFSLDADTVVERNYVSSIYDFFESRTELNGISIYYEHPLPKNDKLKNALIEYELHLRYYVRMLRNIGFPFSFHTIGSALAVDYKSYLRQNGMPKKQGGEDFYFLNKVMLVGNYCDFNETTIYPYGRPTRKTPFGTGVALHSILNSNDGHFYTYHPDAFLMLKSIWKNIEHRLGVDCEKYMKGLKKIVREFLLTIDFCNKVKLIRNNTKDDFTFRKAFFTWFDGFKAVKFMNYLHQNDYLTKIPVTEAVEAVYKKNYSPSEYLDYLRTYDKMKTMCLTSELTINEN